MSELTIKGKWQNELGSIMNITEFGEKTFSGVYYTSVGEVKKGEGNPLHGTYHIETWMDEKKVKHTSFLATIVVQWVNRKEKSSNPSCTTWNGKCDLSDDEKTVKGIDTTWLLRRFTTSFKNWDGIIMGKDYFVKYE